MKFDPEIVALFEQITSTTDPEETIDFAYSNAERLFREGKYFEAHEVLEFQWKKDFGIRKIFLQGIIQLCVSLHKIYVKPNSRGSRMQAERSKENWKLFLTLMI
ncbi:PF03745 domain protein [Leptospira interrogans serovar Australis str. 200703203]|uniref:PF03745 domain protein n=1 Tax=Leptospira interrogans serovar Australis str. 200703203 TaxID=1085541 RepID=N1UP66_LEPIR|nr:PF03745 domain protein [Leptospira interrogans serovar Australis str. 200703203]